MQNKEGVWRRRFTMEIVTAKLVWIFPNNLIRIVSVRVLAEKQNWCERSRMLMSMLVLSGLDQTPSGTHRSIYAYFPTAKSAVGENVEARTCRHKWEPWRVATGTHRNQVDPVSLQRWGHDGCRRRKHPLPYCCTALSPKLEEAVRAVMGDEETEGPVPPPLWTWASRSATR